MRKGTGGVVAEEVKFGDITVRQEWVHEKLSKWVGGIDHGDGVTEKVVIEKSLFHQDVELGKKKKMPVDTRTILVAWDMADKNIDKTGNTIRSVDYVLTKDAETGKWRVFMLAPTDYKDLAGLADYIEVEKINKAFETFAQYAKVIDWINKDDWFFDYDLAIQHAKGKNVADSFRAYRGK